MAMSLFSFIHIKNSQWHVTYYIMSLPQLKVPSILPHGHRSHFKHIICQPRFGPSNIRMNWMIDGFYCVLHVGCECGLATRSYVCVLWSFICVKIKEKKNENIMKHLASGKNDDGLATQQGVTCLFHIFAVINISFLYIINNIHNVM